jgi:hypothetical protein
MFALLQHVFEGFWNSFQLWVMGQRSQHQLVSAFYSVFRGPELELFCGLSVHTYWVWTSWMLWAYWKLWCLYDPLQSGEMNYSCWFSTVPHASSIADSSQCHVVITGGNSGVHFRASYESSHPGHSLLSLSLSGLLSSGTHRIKC